MFRDLFPRKLSWSSFGGIPGHAAHIIHSNCEWPISFSDDVTNDGVEVSTILQVYFKLGKYKDTVRQ